jgi:hypothetical protein
MATFTIDLITGNLYLFTNNFSGNTPTSGTTYPQVSNYSSLPLAGSHSGQIYVVRQGEGTYVLNRKPAGLYFSTGIIWRYLGEAPADLLKSDNFQILDSVDVSKGVMFVTSGISTSVFRKLKVQNSDGTIAYLADLATKVDISAFADYTGTTLTLINTKSSQASVATFTGTTLPTNYYNKAEIHAYTGDTLVLINAKQNTLIAGAGISISGNTISATGSFSSNSALQLLDISGGTNVNTISATPITWTMQVFSGTSLSFTGGSRIYIQASGVYEISYVLNLTSTSTKNIGSVIRKNGNVDITPLSASSFIFDFTNNSSGNTMPQYLVSLTGGDYIELVGFRIGVNGAAYTKANGTWIKIKKN